MREKPRKPRSAVDLYERLGAIPISEVERIRAKAHLARAEHIAEIFARAVAGVKRLARFWIVRPLKRVLGAACA
jgi:hypothetical protein